MKRSYTALAVALILLALPCASLARKNHDFEVKAEFLTHRKSMTDDPHKQTEQKIVDAFKAALGKKLAHCEFEFNIWDPRLPTKQGGVLIEVRGDRDLRTAVERAVRAVRNLKTRFPVRLVRQSIRVKKREREVEESQMHLDHGNWEKAWKKSVDRLQERLRQTVERRIYDAFAKRGHFRRYEDPDYEGDLQGEGDGSDEDDGNEEGEDGELCDHVMIAKGGRTAKKKIIRVRSRIRGHDAHTPREGMLKLLVDKEKKRVIRLIAYDTRLGLILTNLAAQIPVSYVLTTPRLTHHGVSLSIADCSLQQALEALAAAAGGKIERKGGVNYFKGK